MSQAVRPPAPYRAPLWTRVAEGFRYGGGVGQWTWMLHRLCGLGIVVFLVIHILDTFFVVSYPELYDHTVAIYGGMIAGQTYWWLRWAFRLGEWGLIACVLFHAVNGFRVGLFDFWPWSVRLQRELAWAVVTVFVAIMIPVTVVVFSPLTQASHHWKMPGPKAQPTGFASAPLSPSSGR